MPTFRFQRYRPAAIRIWHWLNALAILGLLATVLLRKTWLSWRTNSALIEAELQGAGTPVTPAVAKQIAVALRAPMWDWHYVFGFTLAGLLVARLVVAIGWPGERPLAALIGAVRGFGSAGPEHKATAGHHVAVKLGYAAFYGCALFMAVSGVTMYFEDALGLTSELEHQIKEVHETMMWFFAFFAAAHVVGVVVAELRGSAGIVSDMIQGGKED